MTASLPQPSIRQMAALDPLTRPPLDRYCDVVLDGGVINGVVYPGFLIEIARKFRFRSLGGTSVGAIAASLAAAGFALVLKPIGQRSSLVAKCASVAA